jgi:hypothetical protein
MRFSLLRLIIVSLMVSLAVSFAELFAQQLPPDVSLSVSASAQLAVEDESPVLPDDFAKNDPPQISANWLPREALNASAEKGSGITLFSSDGTWRCGPCVEQQKILAGNPPTFEFAMVGVPKEGQSPSGLVPCWQGADGAVFTGVMSASQLESWAKAHGPKPKTSGAKKPTDVKPLSSVEVDSRNASAVLLALASHVERSQKPKPESVSGRTWLPEIDVDLNDPFLKMLDGLLSADGIQLGGARVAWPTGQRSIAFDPPVQASYRKILEVSVAIKAVEVSGREVVLRLDGRLIPDLKVILK